MLTNQQKAFIRIVYKEHIYGLPKASLMQHCKKIGTTLRDPLDFNICNHNNCVSCRAIEKVIKDKISQLNKTQ